MSGFTIDLAALPAGSSRIRVESRASDLDLPAEGWVGPVVGTLEVERSGDRISLRGNLEAAARMECVRCLTGYEMALRAPLEVFAERAGSGVRLEEEELERDDYMMFHDGRHLDLRDEAREALLLELPMAPHCREDCAGLCPRCGANLNQGACGCGPEPERSAR
jgi:uncharacterized protein